MHNSSGARELVLHARWSQPPPALATQSPTTTAAATLQARPAAWVEMASSTAAVQFEFVPQFDLQLAAKVRAGCASEWVFSFHTFRFKDLPVMVNEVVFLGMSDLFSFRLFP
jgi:hypothetical protein